MLVYFRYGSIQAMVRAASLTEKFQIQLAISSIYSIMTPVAALTL